LLLRSFQKFSAFHGASSQVQPAALVPAVAAD
jgi:hypothetical protein